MTSKNYENNLLDKDKCSFSDSSCLINPMRETRQKDEGEILDRLLLLIGKKTKEKNIILNSSDILKERKKTHTPQRSAFSCMIIFSWIRFLIKAVSDYKKTNKPWFLWVHIILHLGKEGRKAFDRSKSKVKLKVNSKFGKGSFWSLSFFFFNCNVRGREGKIAGLNELIISSFLSLMVYVVVLGLIILQVGTLNLISPSLS